MKLFISGFILGLFAGVVLGISLVSQRAFRIVNKNLQLIEMAEANTESITELIKMIERNNEMWQLHLKNQHGIEIELK